MAGAARAPSRVLHTRFDGRLDRLRSGGGGGGGGGGGKKKKQKQQPLTFTGTVVRANPVAQSYTIATSAGGLIAIHADTLPNVGDQVESPVRKLKNGTYAEQGARRADGHDRQRELPGDRHLLRGPGATCRRRADGSSSTDHYVYAVSSVGASVLVSAPHPGRGLRRRSGRRSRSESTSGLTSSHR